MERASSNRSMLTSPGLRRTESAGVTNAADSALTPATGRRASTDSNSVLSPMHPPKAVHRDPQDHVEEEDSSWVGRKVDAIFSPVLSFLNNSQQEANVASVTDEDVAMEELLRKDDDTQPTESTSSSGTPEGAKESFGLEDQEAGSDCDSLAAMEDDPHADEDEFNPWQFIKSLPKYQRVKHLCPPVALPPKDTDAPPITLVLDLDETLVHCTVETIENADLTFPVEFHNMTYQVHVRLRPHLFNFLSKIQGKFEVIVFTASQKVYANELLNLIDPEGKYIHHRLFRESCLAVEGNFLKDLNVLGRDITKTVLVDNSPHAFGYQVDNGIPIESWFDDETDRELLKLERFLRQLRDVHDVREKIRNKFKCHELIANAPAFA